MPKFLLLSFSHTAIDDASFLHFVARHTPHAHYLPASQPLRPARDMMPRPIHFDDVSFAVAFLYVR